MKPGNGRAHEAALAFMKILESTPPLRAQARLLNTADRDLAALLFALSEDEREPVYLAVGPGKSGRLRSELVRMGHVRLDAETVSRIAAHLAEHLGADRPLGPASRYFRPRRPSDAED
jgi:hypothetical protein